MGMSVSAGGKGGRRRRGVPRYGAMAEINMTPFIDVMLVLLIIFMVAAPLLATGVPLNLPQANTPALNVDRKQVTVSISQAGAIYLENEPSPISQEELLNVVNKLTDKAMDQRIIVRGDRDATYGRVAEILALLTKGGYSRVALSTNPDDKVLKGN